MSVSLVIAVCCGIATVSTAVAATVAGRTVYILVVHSPCYVSASQVCVFLQQLFLPSILISLFGCLRVTLYRLANSVALDFANLYYSSVLDEVTCVYYTKLLCETLILLTLCVVLTLCLLLFSIVLYVSEVRSNR